MSEQDLQKFIKKVDQLKELVESIKEAPQRRKQLADCSNHDEVVELAKSWGFDIGRRWGENH